MTHWPVAYPCCAGMRTTVPHHSKDCWNGAVDTLNELTVSQLMESSPKLLQKEITKMTPIVETAQAWLQQCQTVNAADMDLLRARNNLDTQRLILDDLQSILMERVGANRERIAIIVGQHVVLVTHGEGVTALPAQGSTFAARAAR